MQIFLSVCSLLVPVSMTLLGYKWKSNPPKDRQGLSGYRTTMSVSYTHLGLYYMVPRQGRLWVILLANFIFFEWADPAAGIWLLFSVCTTWAGGLWVHRAKSDIGRRAVLFSCLLVNLGLLAVFKYFPVWDLSLIHIWKLQKVIGLIAARKIKSRGKNLRQTDLASGRPAVDSLGIGTVFPGLQA